MKIIRKKVDFNLSKDKFQYFLDFINEEEKDKILKYRRYEDSLRSLYGKLILKNVLNLDKIQLKYNKWGKPELLNNSKIHFNISHSGEWVVVGIATEPIGVDIQKIGEIDLSIMKNCFSKMENEYILSLCKNSRKDAFFKLWTLKEAFIKSKGMGLYMPLDSFSIDISSYKPILYNDKNEKCQLSVNRIEKDYFMAICILKD
ncbi:4'-phosphopantetheinyl transferase superfamily protein [Clostridium estertheticum]|uniref:4'-phosphopantetheinyl transferase family protein n=1 Tax=Clostridium estertheticum TaxID=238834 RepID=UPI001C6E9B2F|nr:4'-phosphopantetheinyl transferase superfamily protein [Clostridium estertheticum]MBW9154570.1 4'-phosphopantetheinyl transferase superfamily protein [Clostridium estertheticum]WLC83811.1 4'-phosphopantetheinyl transferase superfamily protein [Clostridium estertheticum]